MTTSQTNATPNFDWRDPLMFDGQLVEEERQIRDSARAYAQGELLPRVTSAYLEERPEPNPHDRLITYPSEPMTMWPISTRVNAPENDDPSLLDQVDEVASDQKDLMRVSTVR